MSLFFISFGTYLRWFLAVEAETKITEILLKIGRMSRDKGVYSIETV